MSTQREIASSASRSGPIRSGLVALVVLSTTLIVGCGNSTAPPGEDASAPPTPVPTLSFAAIAGEWVGEGHDLGQPAVYEIEMALDPEAALGSSVGTVSYKGSLNDLVIDCGGRLTAREASASTYELGESITHGINCINGGTVRLTHEANGTLSYEWHSPSGGPKAAEGVLQRKE